MPSRSPIALGLLLLGSAAGAQDIRLGADLVSRYVWRGYDYGQAASI